MSFIFALIGILNFVNAVVAWVIHTSYLALLEVGDIFSGVISEKNSDFVKRFGFNAVLCVGREVMECLKFLNRYTRSIFLMCSSMSFHFAGMKL